MPTDRRTDSETDMTMLIVTICQSVNVPRNNEIYQAFRHLNVYAST